MLKEEKIAALKALAIKHPRREFVGYLWKNPLNPRSTGRRWRYKDLEMFRRFQADVLAGKVK
jgi:hypothetical protein